jgi:RNA polymerase sigma-70 factor (ECF subfamily)
VDQLRKRKTNGAPRFHTNGDARTATVEGVADPASLNLDSVWDQEWEHQILEAAVQRVKHKVKPEHYQIFHLCVFKEWPVKKVAAELDVSAAQVYLVKHRVGALLRKEVKAMEQRMNEH